MQFDIVAWMTNPFILMFVAVLTGMAFGKVKFGRFNFGVSGTLFTGLLIGWLVYRFGISIEEGQDGFKAAQKMMGAGVVSKNFFYLFLILFVAAVGLLAAKDMGVVLKKYGAKFVVLGFTITFIGAAVTYGMTFFSSSSNPYEVAGVYTGALTSSPGLAAAIETARDHATESVETFSTMGPKKQEKLAKVMNIEAEPDSNGVITLSSTQKEQYIKNAEAGIGVGHAIGYPFGVLIVILAVNFFPRLFSLNVEEERKRFIQEMNEARKSVKVKEVEGVSFDLIGFSTACFLGYTIGKISINLGPLGYFSLGSTGGVLIGSLILGYIGKIGFINFRMDAKILGIIRQLSLAFFLAIVGLRYGYMVIDALMGSGAYLAFVSLVVGTIAMLVGFFLGRYVLKINWIMLSGAICGGMTSTPGLGAAVEAVGGDEPAAGYGATYPFALLGMVLFTIILHRLPM